MRTLALAAFAASFVTVAGPLRAQLPCSEWTPGFEVPGLDGPVEVTAVLDDGSGPALYVGGSFTYAGAARSFGIARWDGASWSGVGGGVDVVTGYEEVRALAFFDDGTGPALYVAGEFESVGGVEAHSVARWDGASWTAVGGGLVFGRGVEDLIAFDDGSGPRLFACGSFFDVAAWDGNTWSLFGGLTGGAGVLEVYDGRLYVGGNFTFVQSVSSPGLALWDGALGALAPLPNPENLQSVVVHALRAFDPGGGERLYVGGSFTSPSGFDTLAAYTTSGWSAVGGGLAVLSGPGPVVEDLEVVDLGAGPQLFAAGRFELAGGVRASGLAAWDGATWSAPPGTFDPQETYVRYPTSLAGLGAGAGAQLFAAGDYSLVDTLLVRGIASWDGGAWSALGAEGAWLDDEVLAFGSFDDGQGESLYAGGRFLNTSGQYTEHLVRWDGASWSGAAGGVVLSQGGGVVRALEVFAGELWVGGSFNTVGNVGVFNVASWDGASWSNPGGGLTTGGVLALAAFDDGTGQALYAGGAFVKAGGVPGFDRIARWDGTSWSRVGGGVDARVFALAVFDDGTGEALYAGGRFATASGNPVEHVARWDGAVWSEVGHGLSGFFPTVRALAVHDDGGGPALYAGGSFESSGATPMTGVARWDGASWSQVGAIGTGADVHSLVVHRENPALAPVLVAGGAVPDVDGTARHLARWDGASWSDLDVNAEVFALASFDDGSSGGPSLFAGGAFRGAGAFSSSYVARLAPSAVCEPVTYCTAGTSASGCVASISATGTPSSTAVSGFVLSISDLEGAKDGLFFYGTNGRQANPWGSGTSYVCVVPPRLRGGLLSSTGSLPGTCDGALSQDLNARWCATCPKPAHNPGAGALMQAQLWYRDPASTSNQTSSMSDAIEFLVAP